MANNYDDYEYDEGYDKDNSGIIKKIGIALLIILSIIIVLLLIKGCSKDKGKDKINDVFDYERTLLEAGKKYYENNIDEIPNVKGECSSVTLQTLIAQGLVDQANYMTCNSINTLVRVCMLENGQKQYTPWLSCDDKSSENEYGMLKEGTVADIYTDQTYVEFKFLPKAMNKNTSKLGEVEEIWKDDIKYESYKTLSTTTYYKYRDKLFTWDITKKLYYSNGTEKNGASDVKEYYTKAPNSKYSLSDSKTTAAYKWYTTTQKKEYATNADGSKKTSTSAIGSYNIKEGGVYRTAYETRDVVGTYKPVKYYKCSVNAKTTKSYVLQTVPCPSDHNPEYKYFIENIYSCDKSGKTADSIMEGKVDNANATCYTYGDWKKDYSYTPCDTKKATCRSLTVTLYYWYKLVGTGERTYIPSGANKASGENTYYTSAPVKDAIKDTATGPVTAYKWYRKVESTTTKYTAIAPSGVASATKTDSYKWGDWSSWTKTNPKVNDGRTRQVEKKVKVRLQRILDDTASNWEMLSNDYISEEAMIKLFNDKGYKVANLDEIDTSGEVMYQIKMFVRNKKEVN